MCPCNRVCKAEVISDYQKEVKKIKEVKWFSSRKPGLHHQTESFLIVSNLRFFWIFFDIHENYWNVWIFCILKNVALYLEFDESYWCEWTFCAAHSFWWCPSSEGWDPAGRGGSLPAGTGGFEQRRGRVLLRGPRGLQTGGMLLHLPFVLQAVRSSRPGMMTTPTSKCFSVCRLLFLFQIIGLVLLLQENKEREAAEHRRKKTESVRLAAQQCTMTPSTRLATEPDSSSLESALHSFLSTVPRGVSRCRRPRLARVEGSPSALVSEMAEPRQERPEKKEAELQSGGEEVEAKEEVEKTPEVTHKVLCQQTSKSSLTDRDAVLATPDMPATPDTPQPRTRNYFFAQNGDFGSPWTILSPLACSERTSCLRDRQKNRRSSSSGRDATDEGVWESDPDSRLPGQTPLSVHLPGRPAKISVSRLLDFRSISVDGCRPSQTSRFRLGQWFHRAAPRRSFSLTEKGICPGEGTTHLEGASGLISFFRRIGGRTKPSSVKEQNFQGSRTWFYQVFRSQDKRQSLSVFNLCF